jgi:hypothetical protein
MTQKEGGVFGPKDVVKAWLNGAEFHDDVVEACPLCSGRGYTERTLASSVESVPDLRGWIVTLPIPDGEVWLVQNGKVVGKVVNIGDDAEID